MPIVDAGGARARFATPLSCPVRVSIDVAARGALTLSAVRADAEMVARVYAPEFELVASTAADVISAESGGSGGAARCEGGGEPERHSLCAWPVVVARAAGILAFSFALAIESDERDYLATKSAEHAELQL